MKHILFVCHGNICRSAMAKYIARFLADPERVTFDSAATSREEIGADLYPPAKRTLQTHGIPFDRHYARQVKPEDYDRCDAIVVMDQNNLRNIRRIISSDPEHKIRMLLDRDVADPWYTGDFETTYRDLTAGICSLLEASAEKNGTVGKTGKRTQA
ncbi:low molecular weight protein-tyrosine-phosphatase [Faecalibaculum rodentium]|uniref:low molecular weight protein-tyrosine-phosphatase n=1 Tax=Faecalibaculum rodentium TaxID=1702221 RepID=UPI00259B8ED7|nr:low molecular weight protein-tyrosine-phosphatase [Faecalibaculum rodentium]